MLLLERERPSEALSGDAAGAQPLGDPIDLARARQEDEGATRRYVREGVGAHTGDVTEEVARDAALVERANVARRRRPTHLERMRGHVDLARARSRAEQLGPRRHVERRRHRDEGEVVAQLPELAEHPDREIAVERALVHLIEHDGIDAREFGVGEQAPHEQARGDELNAGRGRRAPLAAHRITDRIPESRAAELRESARGRAGRDAARLCDDDAAVRELGDRGRHDRRLARSRRRGNDGPRARLGERIPQLGEQGGGGEALGDPREVEHPFQCAASISVTLRGDSDTSTARRGGAVGRGRLVRTMPLPGSRVRCRLSKGHPWTYLPEPSAWSF